MNCPSCGTALADGAVFCATCGARTGAVGAGPAPAAAAAPPGMPPMPMQPMHGATRTSGLAIAGFVCAFFCGLVGLVLSILGLSEINKSNGAVTGKGFAIAGLVLSIVGTIGILASVSIPAFMEYMKKSKKSEAMLELNMLGRNAKTYFIENGRFPEGSAPLTPAESCCHGQGAKCPATPAAWQTPEWKAVDFQIDEPGHYQYSYSSDGKTFDATAVGDLDCDEQMATYHLHLEAHDGNPQMSIVEPPPNVY